MPSQSCSTFDELYALSPFDCALLAVDCGVDDGVCGPGFTRRRLEALGDEVLDRSKHCWRASFASFFTIVRWTLKAAFHCVCVKGLVN